MAQGKLDIDHNGLIDCYNIPKAMTMTDFEINITNTLSWPKINVTQK